MCDCQVETSAINCRNSDRSCKIADKRIKATLAVGRQGSLATLDNALSRTADFGLKREAAEKIIEERGRKSPAVSGQCIYMVGKSFLKMENGDLPRSILPRYLHGSPACNAPASSSQQA